MGQLFVPRLIGRWRKGTALAVANTFLGLGFAGVALADRVPGYLAAASVWTAGSMIAAPPNAAVIAELSPAALRGRYQSVFFSGLSRGQLHRARGRRSQPAILRRLALDHLRRAGLLAATGHLLIQPARERRVAKQREAERFTVPVAG